jgi:phospho-N-acetylmuramoyl-pentapeptide-transferase
VPALTVLFVTLACGAIGFLDDFIKLTHRRSLGLRGRWKLLPARADHGRRRLRRRPPGLPTSVFIPIVHWNVELSYGWYVLLFLVIAGTVNGVNLDRRARRSRGRARDHRADHVHRDLRRDVHPVRQPESPLRQPLDLAIVGAALIGATIGFLWYNAFPPR